MQFTNTIILATCLALVHASPVKRWSPAQIVFHGAAGAQYSLTVPLDGSVVTTNNALSISTISASIDVASLCTLKTVDYPPALVEGPPGTWAVGPPQTVISISCSDKGVVPPPPVQTVHIEFDGAADAKYSLTVPLDGTVVPTNNALSISTIVTDFKELASQCDIVYVDLPAALVLISTNTWAVGPPQTIKSIACKL